MTLFLAQSNGLISYFLQSNLAGQAIIYILIICSAIAWTVMVGKFSDLNKLHNKNKLTQFKLNKIAKITKSNPQDFNTLDNPYAFLIVESLKALHMCGLEKNIPVKTKMGYVENALQRTVANITLIYEAKMILLGTIISGAPFLGLLGTAWGVMDAFGSMDAAGATLQNLAPGVSGALLTTVMGLVVAIPSVFGYNLLLTRCKQMNTNLENFASTLADKIELELESENYFKSEQIKQNNTNESFANNNFSSSSQDNQENANCQTEELKNPFATNDFSPERDFEE